MFMAYFCSKCCHGNLSAVSQDCGVVSHRLYFLHLSGPSALVRILGLNLVIVRPGKNLKLSWKWTFLRDNHPKHASVSKDKWLGGNTKSLFWTCRCRLQSKPQTLCFVVKKGIRLWKNKKSKRAGCNLPGRTQSVISRGTLHRSV